MQPGVDWPAPLTHYLHRAYGPLIELIQLAGLSGSQFYRLKYERHSFVLKSGLSPRELLVYRRFGPLFALNGVTIPRLEHYWQLEGQSWLLLEDIPLPLPHSRWWDDKAVLGLLYQLHQLPPAPNLDFEELFQPAWSDEITLAALACFTPALRQTLTPLLNRLQNQFQPFFEPSSYISGDPNVLNWGVRADGAVALFDWERFGRGSPLLDLAILHPGLGTQATFSQLAKAYLSMSSRQEVSEAVVENMTADLWLGKTWNQVEFFYLWATGQVNLPEAELRHLTSRFAAWLIKAFA